MCMRQLHPAFGSLGPHMHAGSTGCMQCAHAAVFELNWPVQPGVTCSRQHHAALSKCAWVCGILDTSCRACTGSAGLTILQLVARPGGALLLLGWQWDERCRVGWPDIVGCWQVVATVVAGCWLRSCWCTCCVQGLVGACARSMLAPAGCDVPGNTGQDCMQLVTIQPRILCPTVRHARHFPNTRMAK